MIYPDIIFKLYTVVPIRELLDRVAKDLKNRVEKWQNQIVESKESLYSDIDQKLTLYGLKSTSNIDIAAEKIINDPDLPR